MAGWRGRESLFMAGFEKRDPRPRGLPPSPQSLDPSRQDRRWSPGDRPANMDLFPLVRATGGREKRVAAVCSLLHGTMDVAGVGNVSEEDIREKV